MVRFWHIRLSRFHFARSVSFQQNLINLLSAAEEENEVTVEKVTPREKTAQELEEERRQAEVDAWRDRLINEGQLIDTDKTPLGKFSNRYLDKVGGRLISHFVRCVSGLS